jgi:hypothetical protein
LYLLLRQAALCIKGHVLLLAVEYDLVAQHLTRGFNEGVYQPVVSFVGGRGGLSDRSKP